MPIFERHGLELALLAMSFAQQLLKEKYFCAASDVASDSRKTVGSGSSMLDQLSSALTAVQSTNSTSSPVDLVSTLLGMLSGSGSETSSGTNALSTLSSAQDLQCELQNDLSLTCRPYTHNLLWLFPPPPSTLPLSCARCIL